MGTFGFGGMVPNGSIEMGANFSGGGTVTIFTVPDNQVARICLRIFSANSAMELIIGGSSMIPTPGFANEMPTGNGLVADDLTLNAGQNIQIVNATNVARWSIIGMYFIKGTT